MFILWSAEIFVFPLPHKSFLTAFTWLEIWLWSQKFRFLGNFLGRNRIFQAIICWNWEGDCQKKGIERIFIRTCTSLSLWDPFSNRLQPFFVTSKDLTDVITNIKYKIMSIGCSVLCLTGTRIGPVHVPTGNQSVLDAVRSFIGVVIPNDGIFWLRIAIFRASAT